jgi:hypothetical protein
MSAETDPVLVDAVAVALFEFDWRGSVDHRGAAWISHREKYTKRARAALAALAAPAREVEYGARFLVPHRNAGEAVWMPDVFYAGMIVVETPGMAELVQREVGPWEPVKRDG